MENVEILQVNTTPSVKSISDLKREIKELKGQLLNLEQGTAEYNRVLTEVANKTHDLKEVQEQVARSSNDFGDRLKNVQGTVAGLSGAFQTVLGSLSLMGVEMGDDVKMLKMLQSAMAITQGVAAIDTGVKAFKALTISIRASAMAMNGLKKALITSGIGVAAIAVGILVSKLSELKEKQDEVAEAAKRQAESIKGLAGEVKNLQDIKLRPEDIFDARTFTDGIPQIAEARGLIKKLTEDIAEFRKQAAQHDDAWKYTKEGSAAYEKYYADLKKLAQANYALTQGMRSEEAYTTRKELQQQYGEALLLEQNYQKERTKYVREGTEKRLQAELEARQKHTVQNDTGAFTPTETQQGNPEAEQQLIELQALTEYYQRRAEIMISGEADAQDQLLALDMDYRDKREELLRTRLEDGLITEQEFNNELAQLEVEAVELQIEQEERLTEKTKEETEKRKATNKSYVQALKSVAGSISSILGTIGDNMEEGTQEWKNVKIAQATIDTIAGGITAFMTTMEQIGGIPGIIAGAAAAATVVATGIAEIAKIRNTKVSKNGSGGNTSGMGNVSASAVSVNATQVTPTRQVQTEEDIANLPDTKVYVLEEDITNAQNKVRVINENATY